MRKKGYTYGKRVVYIAYWSEYGPGLGVFVFTFEPDVVVELVWCGGPCKTRKITQVLAWGYEINNKTRTHKKPFLTRLNFELAATLVTTTYRMLTREKKSNSQQKCTWVKCVGVHYDLSVIQRWMPHRGSTYNFERKSCLPACRSVLLHLLLCTLFRMLGFQGSVVVLLFVMMATEIERQAPTGKKETHK